jgi:hypothetical protein
MDIYYMYACNRAYSILEKLQYAQVDRKSFEAFHWKVIDLMRRYQIAQRYRPQIYWFLFREWFSREPFQEELEEFNRVFYAKKKTEQAKLQSSVN